MKLKDCFLTLRELPNSGTIFAMRPWCLDSDAIVVELDVDASVPSAVSSAGYEYFLEVALALEVLSTPWLPPFTADQRDSILIHYAEFDGFPEWTNKMAER